MVSTLKSLYEEQGFVIVPGLVADSDRLELEQAFGKQFPPFDSDNPDSWGVQHLMHPDLGEPIFVKWYTSQPLIAVVKELVECHDEDLQMELFNLLINPTSHDYALRWHRDDVRENATEEEERHALGQWHHGVQWNTALYRDACLYVVPKSHSAPRTPDQRSHSETLDPPSNPLDMPGAIQVVLQPGESVFYNSNILHCATYDSTQRRATLHASMGSTKGGSSRARNILQHGLLWMKDDRFRAGLDEKSSEMLDRLVKLQESNTDVGYSLTS